MTDLAFAPMRKGPPKLSDAVDRITLTASAHEMRDPFDIGDALSTLAQIGEPVTLYPHGHELALARIDRVDLDAKRFALDLVGDAVLTEGRAVFVASLGGNAKIQFELDADWAIVPGEAHLVELPFPTACMVLNRRADDRLDIPIGMDYGARFTMMGKVFEMPLYDYSRGGVGLRATPEQAYELYVGKKLEGVQLDLGPTLRITADLEVRLLRPFRTFLLGQQVQVGCRISNIAMQMRQHLDRAVVKVQRRK
jgi:c-di-GMP-binding flagellar brake protein YcgR